MSLRSLGLVGLAAALALAGCRRADRATPEQIRAEISVLEKERDELRERLNGLVERDARLQGMPATPLRIAVPTTLARELIEKVMAGFVDQVTLELGDIKVSKSGTVKRIVTLGRYDLNVNIDKVSARLKTARPDLRFGGNQVTLAMPVTLASGAGQATIRFKWDGQNLADAACGDLDVEQVVTGSVKPHRYPVQGTLVLSATAEQILVTPRFPRILVKLEIEPSAESWAAVQRILDARKTGVCGFVLDRIDVLSIVRGIVDKGFEVRLPTEKIRPMAIPVGVEPTMSVHGTPVALEIRVGGLAITPQALWLGADVSVQAGRFQATGAATGSAPASARR
ncbi:MAG: hypothetical protein ACM3PV_07905 [Betaproteobacteria bacterium]